MASPKEPPEGAAEARRNALVRTVLIVGAGYLVIASAHYALLTRARPATAAPDIARRATPPPVPPRPPRPLTSAEEQTLWARLTSAFEVPGGEILATVVTPELAGARRFRRELRGIPAPGAAASPLAPQDDRVLLELAVTSPTGLRMSPAEIARSLRGTAGAAEVRLEVHLASLGSLGQRQPDGTRLTLGLWFQASLVAAELGHEALLVLHLDLDGRTASVPLQRSRLLPGRE